MQKIVTSLLKAAIGTSSATLDKEESAMFASLTSKQWSELVMFTGNQGTICVALDGLQKIFDSNPDLKLSITRQDLLKWYKYVAWYEKFYAHCVRTIKATASRFAQEGIRMMVFKGYSLSLSYPIPQHRRFDDIDIYLYDNADKGDSIAAVELGADIPEEIEKHSNFIVRRISVENHHNFLNSVRTPSLMESENRLKELAKEATLDSATGALMPTAQFNAIFLSQHFARHFVFRGARFSHLLDWALFLKSSAKEIDWRELFTISNKIGCTSLLRGLNRIAVRDFGINPEGIPQSEGDDRTADWIHRQLLVPLPPARKGTRLQKLRKYIIWSRRYKKVYGKGFVKYMLNHQE